MKKIFLVESFVSVALSDEDNVTLSLFIISLELKLRKSFKTSLFFCSDADDFFLLIFQIIKAVGLWIGDL